METPSPIQSQHLHSDFASHGFFTRKGGVSNGIFKGLNVGLGSSDERQNIKENRQRVETHIGVEKGYLATVFQIHSPKVIQINKPQGTDARPEADGMVTATSGLAIGILTADCGPVLFLDTDNQVAGACHAGWKGATGGILENTVSSMEKLGAKRDHITAVLGPTISKNNYEVGPEFIDRLMELDNVNDRFLSSSDKKHHAMFDLPGYIVGRLQETGVNATWTGHCTYADEDQFFSYRRKTHRGEEDYGRQISVISLKH